MEWINVDETFLDYLRESEERIPRTDYGKDKYKPFFGILFEMWLMNNAVYYQSSALLPFDTLNLLLVTFLSIKMGGYVVYPPLKKHTANVHDRPW